MTESEEFRVMELGGGLRGMPLALAGEIMKAVGRTCEKNGYEAFFKQETGLGIMWARKVEPKR